MKGNFSRFCCFNEFDKLLKLVNKNDTWFEMLKDKTSNLMKVKPKCFDYLISGIFTLFHIDV